MAIPTPTSLASEPPAATAPVLRWLAAAQSVLERVGATQAENLERASHWCADAIAGGGLVHLFGTGHSRIPVEEMFPRYGSYPGWNPIVELSMTFHTRSWARTASARRWPSSACRPGRGHPVQLRFGPDDVMVVFSASGLTAVPVEMAWRAPTRPARHRRDVGRPVDVGRTEASAGSRLLDEADLVIDLCTPSADALSIIDNLDTPVGPGSTIAAVAIVNSIKVRVAELLVERRAMPPVITRASVVGSERSRRLFDQAYREHSRRIARAIDQGGGG